MESVDGTVEGLYRQWQKDVVKPFLARAPVGWSNLSDVLRDIVVRHSKVGSRYHRDIG